MEVLAHYKRQIVAYFGIRGTATERKGVDEMLTESSVTRTTRHTHTHTNKKNM